MEVVPAFVEGNGDIVVDVDGYDDDDDGAPHNGDTRVGSCATGKGIAFAETRKKSLEKDCIENSGSGSMLQIDTCKACSMSIDQTDQHECPLESMRPGPEGQPSKTPQNEEADPYDPNSSKGDPTVPTKNTGDGDSLKQCKFYRLGCKFVGNRFELDLHMDIGSETHLDIVCKSIQEIKSEYIKKENKIITKHENKIKMLQDYICKQNVIIKDLHHTNRTLENTTRTLQSKLKDVSAQSDSLTDQMNSLKITNNLFSEQLREARDTSYNGTLLWKVTGVSDRMQRAAMNTELSVYSPPFYTRLHGYKLRAQLFLNGHGQHAGEYVSLYFHILPTENDAVLKWPFNHKITFSLLEQTSDVVAATNVSYTLIPSPDDENFRRPNEKMSGGQGRSEFVSLEQLYKGFYVKDDCLFIKVRVHCGKKD